MPLSQTFGSGNVIATDIYGNDSTITFEVEGQGQDQWLSFYHQSELLRPFTQLTKMFRDRLTRL